MSRGVGAILLAAGASSRMGSPKALLPWNGKPLVRHLAEVLLAGGASRVVLVLSPNGGEIGRAIESLPGVAAVVNAKPSLGMLASVQVGLRALGEGPFLVCPCDLPRLDAGSVRAVINAWNEDPSAIVVPTQNEKRGHPTLFGADYFEKTLALDSEEGGLNRLLRIHPVTEIITDSDGPFRDADTPADWAALQPQE